MLAFHYYEPPQVSTTGQIEAQIRGAARLDTGVFLTETVGGHKQVFGDDDKLIYEAADDKLVSWSFWEYKTYCRESDETLESDSQQGVWASCHGFIQALAGQSEVKETGGQQDERTRTFAEAVAGVTRSMLFDAVDHTFTLEYVLDEEIDMPTEIRISKEVRQSEERRLGRGLPSAMTNNTSSAHRFAPRLSRFASLIAGKLSQWIRRGGWWGGRGRAGVGVERGERTIRSLREEGEGEGGQSEQ